MTLPKKIALFYGHVASNIGDLAINSGTVNLLRSACHGVNIDVVLIDADASEFLGAAKSSFDDQGDIRFTYLKTHGEKPSLYLRSPETFFAEAGVSDADVVLLSAGEHFFAYQHEENAKSLFWRTFPAYAAKLAGKKCVQLPSTLGPFETDRSSALLSSLLGLIDALAVRDARSLQLLKTRYATEKPLLLDPAFFLHSPVAAQQAQKTHGATALVMRSEGWGIRLSNASRKEQTERFKASGYEASKAFVFSLEFASRLLNTTDEVLRVFVQTTADQELADELGRRLPEFLESGRLTIERPYSVQDYLSRLAVVDRVVSNRFHALILGMVVGRQTHGLYFDVHGHKIPGLFNLIDAPGRCHDLSNTEPRTAAIAVLDEVARETEVQQKSVQKRVEKLRQDTVAWLNDALQKPTSTADARQLLTASVSLGDFAEGQLKASIENNAKKQIDLAKKSAQAKESQWAQQRQQLEGELSQATAAHQAALEELKAASAEAQAKEAQWAQQRQQLEAELITATAEAQRLLAVNQAQLEALQLELLNTLSNKLGTALIEGIRTPAAVAKLPFQLYKIWRESKSQQPPAALGGESFGEVISAYTNGGLDAVEKLLESYRLPSIVVANACTALARHLKQTDAHQAAKAAHRAYMADPKPFRRKWLAFRLNEAGKFVEAEVLLCTLPSEVEFSKSEESRVREIRNLAKAQRLDSVRRHLGVDFPVTDGRGEKSPQKRTNIADPFGKFRAAMNKKDVREAYTEFTRIKSLAEGGALTPDQHSEFAEISKERVCRLGLLELADTKLPSAVLNSTARRICYVLHNSLPHSSGGYATRAHGVALGLKASGWDVIALTRPGYPLDMKPELSADALETSVTIDGIKYLFIEKPLKRGSKSKRGMDTDQYILAAADALLDSFRTLKPTVVMAASNYLTALPALIAARRLGLPFVYEVRGFWEITSMSRNPNYATTIPYMVEQEMEAGVAERADHVFTLTEPMREELIQRGVSAEKISLLPNSCDINEFLPRSRDAALAQKLKIPASVPVIGYIGTFVDYEGLEDLATACGLLAKEGVEFRLLLVGNENVSGSGLGPIGQTVQRIAADCGYSDWLIMPGRVPKHEVADYYTLIDIAPFPRKPWPVCEMVSPMKPLEAMAMKKAVLASNVRALSEMISQNKTGLLCEKGEVASLTEQLKRLIIDPVLRRNLGVEGRKWVSNERTWELTGKKADSVLARIRSPLALTIEKYLPNPDDELETYRQLLAQTKDAELREDVVPTSENRVIYFLHGSFPHQSGGYATRTHGVVRSVLNAGYEILPYTRPSFPKDLSKVSIKTDFPSADEIGGVTYRRIWADVDRINQPEPVYMLGCIDPFEQVLRQEKPAIVHCRSTYLIAAPALIAARRAGLPFVYEVSGFWELVYDARNTKGQHTATIERMKALETFIIQEADAIVTLTEQMKDELISRGAKPECISMAPNSVDVNVFVRREKNEELKMKLGIAQNESVIGYIGTIVDYEGLDDLFHAAARLIASGSRIKVLIVGSGSGPAQEKMLKNAIAATKMNDHVIMTGRVPHDEVLDYYSICDVMAYPRKPWEVCETVSPMKPFEAMALEKAVLVSSVKALRDITLDGRIGRVFQKGNLDSLVENLGALLESPEECQRLGKAAREWVAKNRSWDAAAKEIVWAYRHAKSRITPPVKRDMAVAQPARVTDKETTNKSPTPSTKYPAWWDIVPLEFRARSGFVNVTDWYLSESVNELTSEYIGRFGEEAVKKRIPLVNWQRADICNGIIKNASPSNLLDIGSGLGEFVNLFSSTNPNVPIASVDVKDYSLWFDRTGRVERIYKSIFDLGPDEVRDVVTCFEVIEHLPPERLAEAVERLRSLARRKLFVSVPFMESLPLYKGHFTRFDDVNLLSLFPDAKFTIFGKGGKNKNKVHAWIMCEIDRNAT